MLFGCATELGNKSHTEFLCLKGVASNHHGLRQQFSKYIGEKREIGIIRIVDIDAGKSGEACAGDPCGAAKNDRVLVIARRFIKIAMASENACQGFDLLDLHGEELSEKGFHRQLCVGSEACFFNSWWARPTEP